MQQSSELELLLVDIWSKELGIAQIGINQNFFDLGSKSLTIRKVQVELQKQLRYSVPITAFFSHPTVKQLAHYLTHEL
jgi:acyl carrier protein